MPNKVLDTYDVVAEVVKLAGGDVVVAATFGQVHVQINPSTLVLSQDADF